MPADPRPSRRLPLPLRAPNQSAATSPQIDGGVPLDSGTIVLTSTNDTSAGAGGVGPGGTLAKTSTADTSTAAGGVGPSGTLAKTSTADTPAASGGVGPAGTLARTSTADTCAGTGGTGPNGTLAVAESRDTLTANGSVTLPSSGAGKWGITRQDREALDRHREGEEHQRMLMRDDEELFAVI